jgi:hypothetical protein
VGLSHNEGGTARTAALGAIVLLAALSTLAGSLGRRA